MAGLLMLLLIVVPIAELWFILEVADGIGLLPTLALLIIVSIAGGLLLKQQGLATWHRLQQTMARGEMPTKEVTDGALILLGGALLLTPGFLTDIVGLVLLFPWTRGGLKHVVRAALARRVMKRFGYVGRAGRRVYSARTVRVERNDETTSPSETPDPLPSSRHPHGEAGSPDTR